MTAPLSDAVVLGTWEIRPGRGPAARALALARAAANGEDPGGWTAGHRDALLLDLHVSTFGGRFSGLVSCPECEEALELDFAADTVRAASGDEHDEHELVVEATGHRIVYRLPRCDDVVAAAARADVTAARVELIDRCVIRAERKGCRIRARRLPPRIVAAVAAAMADADPQAEVRLALECPACEHRWSALFDIAEFLVREVDERARLLVGEIAELAAAFGWTEREILDLPPGRRSLYLELVRA